MPVIGATRRGGQPRDHLGRGGRAHPLRRRRRDHRRAARYQRPRPPRAGTPRGASRAGEGVPDPGRGPPAHRGRGARRGRRGPADQPRRDAGPGGRVRLRQDHGRAADAAADRRVRRQDHLRRPGHHDAERERPAVLPAPDADHLPGPVRVAGPAHADRRQHRRGAAHPPSRHGPGASGPRGQGDGPGGPPAVPGAALPARVLRWPAAAHRDRPRARAGAGAGGVRRARVRARRVDPGAGAEPAALAPARARA